MNDIPSKAAAAQVGADAITIELPPRSMESI